MRQEPGSPVVFITLIGLDEGVLVALEEPVPQLFLILLAQPELDGPVMAMLIGIHVPDEVPVMARGGSSMQKVSAKWISPWQSRPANRPR